MSRRWPGWENIDGIDVAGGARKAANAGEDFVVMRLYGGPAGVNGPLDMYPVCFHADGTVDIYGDIKSEFGCVITDGMLTGIIHRPSDTHISLVKCLFVQIPGGDSLPFVHNYMAGERVEGQFMNAIDAAIDCSPEDDGCIIAAMAVYTGLDGENAAGLTWPLTSESAAVLSNLMREHHGAPLAESLIEVKAARQSVEDMELRGQAVVLPRDSE